VSLQVDLAALDAHIAKANNDDDRLPVTARWLRAVRAELAATRRDHGVGAMCEGMARAVHPPIAMTADGAAW
jgi:hypothetical protein